MATYTAKQLKELVWTGKDKLYNCGDNLYINVREKSKTWLFRGTLDGKRQKKTIGDYSDYTLRQAREIAYKMRHEKPEVKKLTFAELSHDYLKETDYKQIATLTERVTYLNGVFGHKQIDEITQFDIVEFVRDYRRRSKSLANHYRTHLNQIFKHALALGLLEINPAQNVPQTTSGYKPKSKDKILTNDEIKWLFKQHSHNARVMRFQLLTGLRVTEALKGWVDDDKFRCIAKGGREHWVYLTDTARKQLPFPEGRSPKTIAIWCKRNFLEFRSHDCRRTFSTIANSIGVEPFIVERVLSHKLQGVMGIYNRAEYEAERIDCGLRVEEHIKSLLKAKA